MAERDLYFHYLLALGSNLGNRAEQLAHALEALDQRAKLIKTSRFIETAPLSSTDYPTADHESYLNSVCHLASPQHPFALYDILRELEDSAGHPRDRKWLPRHLDLDIIFCGIGKSQAHFDDCVPFLFRRLSGLEVPHREFWNRDFLVELVSTDLGISIEKLRLHREGT